MRFSVTTALLALLLGLGASPRLETRDSSELDPVAQATAPIKWPKRTIEVAFSNSLNQPGANIKTGSDVVGAARRALQRWSAMANITFVVTWSSATSVSPAAGGDGISLITVADTVENESFNVDSNTGRTRVFYDAESGEIAEADISINPRPRSPEGADLQFSTDGTPGTYDLEATFTHEIGHLLGLDHSAMLASTMQSRQAFNGTYGLPAFTERTLSEDDRQRIRTLYGPKQRLGRIEGRLIDNQSPDTLAPSQVFNVWAESVQTGRVMASGTTAADGTYSLEGLTAGNYRVVAAPRVDEDSTIETTSQKRLRSFEISSQLAVKSDAPTALNYNVLPQQSQSALSPQWVGLRGELSSVALPVEPGKRIKVYLGGEGIDQVPGTSISVTSPYFTVDAGSLTREQLSSPFPVVSIELNVAPNAPFGDYSLRLQSNTGEIAYVPGALTIDPGVAYSVANPVDDARFLVNQQYTDLLGRPPERELVEKLTAQLAQCGGRTDCIRARRLELSTNLFLEHAMQPGAIFLNGVYLAGVGRRPRLTEFESDRNLLSNNKNDAESSHAQFALAFVQRAEFEKRFSNSLNARQFVDSLLTSIKQSVNVDLTSERMNLVQLFDGTTQGRAAIVSRVAATQSFIDAHYNQTLVQAQYFSFLRRDPDENGLNSWVSVLKSRPLRDANASRSLVCSFLNSIEYQQRFGLSPTHNGSECN
jgi:hypothetical protein